LPREHGHGREGLWPGEVVEGWPLGASGWRDVALAWLVINRVAFVRLTHLAGCRRRANTGMVAAAQDVIPYYRIGPVTTLCALILIREGCLMWA